MNPKNKSSEHTVSAVFGFEKKAPLERPLFLSRIAAGFPSPADDYLDRRLDLNEYLIPHPAATFFVRVSGDSMIGAGIHHGDLLIVDRSRDLEHGKIVIAVLHGELTVKRYREIREKRFLAAENPDYPAIELGPDDPLEIWGIVTSVIHTL
jgi:DNA polymerase V